MKYLRERRKLLGGYLPQRDANAPALDSAAARSVRLAAAGLRRSRVLDDDGAGAHPADAGEGQEHRQARRADRAGRGAHVRHGRHVPPGRHLFLDGPAVHAAGRRSADVLQGRQEGPDPRGRHQRRRRAVLVHRGRHGVRESRRQHGAVLHLLLDVRLPARRRFHLGRRRQPGARLPDRRHGGSHDARRRRPAAPGRAQSAAVDARCRTACRTIRHSRTSSR